MKYRNRVRIPLEIVPMSVLSLLFCANNAFCGTKLLNEFWVDSAPFFAHCTTTDHDGAARYATFDSLDDLAEFLAKETRKRGVKLNRREVVVDELVRCDFPLLILKPETNMFFTLLGVIYKDDSNEPYFQISQGDVPPALYSKLELSRLLNKTKVDVCTFASKNEWCKYKLGKSAVEINRLYYNFGYLTRTNQGYVASFNIVNTGKNPIFLGNPQTSCACTVLAEGIKNVLESGESQTIKVKVSPPAPSKTSFLHKVLLSLSCSQTHVSRDLVFYVTGNIEQSPLQITPEKLDFEEIVEGMEYARTVRIVGIGDRPFRVLSVTASLPCISTQIKEAAHGDGRQEVLVSVVVSGCKNDQIFNSKVIIETDETRQSVIEIPIKAKIVSPISISPSKITWGIIKMGETKEKVIQVEHFNGDPFEIIDVVFGQGTTVESLKNVSNDGRKVFRIKKTFSVPGVVEENIKFTINYNGSVQSIAVPIYSLVRKGD